MIYVLTHALNDVLAKQLTKAVAHACDQASLRNEVLLQTTNYATALHALQDPPGDCFFIAEPEEIAQIQNSPDIPHHLLWILLFKDMHLLAESVNQGIQPNGVLTYPLDRRRVQECFSRVLARYRAEQAPTSAHVLFQFGKTSYRLAMDSIYYVEAQGKNVEVHTALQSVTVSNNLKYVFDQLDDQFFQCHRSYIINRRHINCVRYATMEIELTNGEVLPLSRASRKPLEAFLEKEI